MSNIDDRRLQNWLETGNSTVTNVHLALTSTRETRCLCPLRAKQEVSTITPGTHRRHFLGPRTFPFLLGNLQPIQSPTLSF